MTDKTPTDYELRLVNYMREKDMTLCEAMYYDMEAARVDTSSALGICDYLEEQLVDLNKVQYYALIFTGQEPDLELRKM